MPTEKTLAERSAEASAAKALIDAERAAALVALTETAAFAEVLAAASALFDPNEQAIAGVNAAASHVVTVLSNLPTNANLALAQSNASLNPVSILPPPLPANP